MRAALAVVSKVPLILTPQAEGGHVVTSRGLPELLTEGETIEEAGAHAQDAWQAASEPYQDLEKPLPPELRQNVQDQEIRFAYLISEA
jgi:antitoxin HicB